MNKYLRYLLAVLFLAPFFLTSCQNEMKDGGLDIARKETVRFSIEKRLRAVGDDRQPNIPTPSLNREKKIATLYAIVYHQESGLYYKTIKCAEVQGEEGYYEFDNEKSGKFFFFLVANPDEALLAKLNDGPASKEELGMLIATQTPGEDNEADHFLMTSDQQTVEVTSGTTTNLPDVITLERVAARFDFYNKVPGLNITEIVFGQRYVESHLFPQVGKMDELKMTGDKSYAGELFKNSALTATVYGYENDKVNETYFTLKGTFNGKPINDQEIRIENLTIKRNHLYNIYLHSAGGAVTPDDRNDPNSKFGALRATIEVLDWNKAETLYYPEADVYKSQMVDWSAEIKEAPYMNAYLTNSPAEVYTTRKGETTLTLTVGTYIDEGTLELKDPDNAGGVRLEADGTSTKDAITGKITRKYTLTIPPKDEYEKVGPNSAKDGIDLPSFTSTILVAKNGAGNTVKEFTVKHGRPKMPLEYLSKTPLNKEGTAFAKSGNKFEDVGYFPYTDFEKFSKVKIDGKNYRMISDRYELVTFYPYSVNSKGLIGPGKENLNEVLNVEEIVSFPTFYQAFTGNKSVLIKMSADYKLYRSENTTYALKFKPQPGDKNNKPGKLLLMAYKYEWQGTFKRRNDEVKKVTDTQGNITYEAPELTAYYKVTSIYLGPNWNGSVEDLNDPTIWEGNGSETREIEERVFYPLSNYDWSPYVFPLLDYGANFALVSNEFTPIDEIGNRIISVYFNAFNARIAGSYNRLTLNQSISYPIFLIEDTRE